MQQQAMTSVAWIKGSAWKDRERARLKWNMGNGSQSMNVQNGPANLHPPLPQEDGLKCPHGDPGQMLPAWSFSWL